MKFGKHIQKIQLEIPEYAASFVDYKALKRLIKSLSATPLLTAQNEPSDPQASLQANKATFFFKLEGELVKVNTFYLQKEAELKLRLKSLLEKKRAMQSQPNPVSKLSSRYISIEEGFKQFSSHLSKLQQFVEVNALAFSKILKKWDKTSKSREKEIYLSRAVEIQPCFNRDIISDLSDQATSNLLEFSAWADGDEIQYASNHIDSGYQEAIAERSRAQSLERDDGEAESQIIQAVISGNTSVLGEWANRINSFQDARERITRVFLSTADEAPDSSLDLLFSTKLVDLNALDEISNRNILHKASMSGRIKLLDMGLDGSANIRKSDTYGRIPLHYASMHGHVEIVRKLADAAPDTIDFKDHDNFTPLVHAIVKSHLNCVQTLLSRPDHARIDPLGENDHIPLNLACQHGSIPIVKLLLGQNPQVLPDAEGLYPQHLVARSADTPELLLLLKEHGANLDQADKLYQWTPLFHAASEGKVQCLETLLRLGANTDATDEKGLYAMYYATWEGHLECMRLLAAKENGVSSSTSTTSQSLSYPSKPSAPPSSMPAPMGMDADSIPDIHLPPPIIPVRRYGHNFLESKTFVVINFANLGFDPIKFYDTNYPASRLTISSKSSNLIPRNIPLPMQDDAKVISFQIDDLESFSIEFDIYPTFGAKVIARTEATSQIFTGWDRSSGLCLLPLFDPRLRALGEIRFQFQIVKPFVGMPLEITHFATYWKATSQLESHPSAFVTGSSLSGNYVRLFVQLTSAGNVVLYPRWTVNHAGLNIPVQALRLEHVGIIGAEQRSIALKSLKEARPDDIPLIHKALASTVWSLQEVLLMLPAQVNVELHVLYPSSSELEETKPHYVPDMNHYVDSLLKIVFDDARKTREQPNTLNRSVVFSSFNPDICVALNWKQPNYPVLLCNELGVASGASSPTVRSSGRTTISVKEAVHISRNNNLMGLISSSRLLGLAPSLITAIKTAGLVLITDVSEVADVRDERRDPIANTASSAFFGVPEGVDGTLKGNGVLRFNDSIDM
ncbi:putative cyclin dependent kinase inhibitor Pho81 [Aulographum hederae CBS 113979]|uniref:Putative cyclin dependent kinase inhibitor Pho81 n=1 Tax=Aulographum hederae CBS 113979 TaxID=1176131 RepID=A0A6G1H563_9PEZI|nr:putative cyclin dependent kinase inhibitor Pho81 [Aulographum hederae CBS 113979]